MSPENSISLGAAVISLIALGGFIWSEYRQRRHDRLSVKPAVSLTFDRTWDDTKKAGLYLSNDGLGPAILKSLIVSDGHSTLLNISKEGWKSLLVAEFDLIGRSQFFKDTALSAGATRYLLYAHPELTHEQFDMLLLKAIGRLKFTLYYESFYKEQFLEEIDIAKILKEQTEYS